MASAIAKKGNEMNAALAVRLAVFTTPFSQTE
jgi:hypothetical protein